MNILYTTTFYPNTDGTSNFIQGLSETLNSFGHNAIVLSSDQETSLKIKSIENLNVIKIPYQVSNYFIKNLSKKRRKSLLTYIKKVINNIESRIISFIRREANKHSFSFLYGLFYDPFGWKLLLKLLKLRTKDVDIIVTTPVCMSCITASLIAAKMKKIPIIITPAYHFMLKSYTQHDKKWAKILKKFDLVITYTYAELNYLHKIGVPRNLLKKIGVGVPFYRINSAGDGNWRKTLKIPKDKFVIIYLTTAIKDRKKGIDTLIKAAINLPSIHFIFVGRSKEDWNKILNLYKLHKQINISYIEFVSNKEKFQLFNAIDLVVKPSLNDSFGLVYFEGMSAGKPIITSNIKAMVEIAKDVGITVPYDNANELIIAIERLNNDKKLYKKLSENAIIKAKKFDWENVAKEYEKTFRHLIEVLNGNKKRN